MTIVGRGLGRGGNSIVVTYGYGRGVEVAGHPICTEIWVAAAGATLAVSIATAGAAAHPWRITLSATKADGPAVVAAGVKLTKTFAPVIEEADETVAIAVDQGDLAVTVALATCTVVAAGATATAEALSASISLTAEECPECHP